MGTSNQGGPSAREVVGFVVSTLRSERSFLALAAIYGIAISLLTLGPPIAVQVLINSVGYTGLTTPLFVLTTALFTILLAFALLNALRFHLMELFARRFYARTTSEMALRALYAQTPFFHDDGRAPLFNRYFDIMLIQKAIPDLMIGGFTIMLQAAVGFVLTSFYHPLFLAFNTVVVLCIWIIWLIFGPSAIRSSVGLSHAKHRTAAWLQGLAASNGYFKSDQHIAYALQRTDEATGEYVEAHRVHFRRLFSQVVGFLLLYAAATAALLGLGGWLVINGQLTLGQLVAAELVLSVAFYGVGQFGTYLNYFYDLCAASEEISLLENIKQEEPSGAEVPGGDGAELVFDGVRGMARGAPAKIDLIIPSGAQVLAAAESHGMQRLFSNLLKRFEEPHGGTFTLGGDDVASADMMALRRTVIVLDRPNLVEMSMRNYLRLARPEAKSSEMLDVLRCVGLDMVIEELDDGLDTDLSSTGWPLSLPEAMRLKLAAAILARPKVLVMNQLFDTVPRSVVGAALERLKNQDTGAPTVIIFSSSAQGLKADHYLWLGLNQQQLFTEENDFHHLANQAPTCEAGPGKLETQHALS